MPVTFNNVTINRVGLHGGRDKLLDKFPGAAAAYSLRSLNSFYRGSVVQVRRSGDNAEETFTANQISDGTLAAWVTAGGGTEDGFVKTWYDQSGNGNDASQATAAAQPKIVASGAVITDNSVAALNFTRASNCFLRASGVAISTATAFASCVSNTVTMNANQGIIGVQSNAILFQTSSNNLYMYAQAYAQISNTNANQRLLTSVYDGTLLTNSDKLKGYENGLQISFSSFNGTVPSTISGTGLEIGKIYAFATNQSFDGTIQEVIVYQSDQSSNRTGIESNIATHYGITLS